MAGVEGFADGSGEEGGLGLAGAGESEDFGVDVEEVLDGLGGGLADFFGCGLAGGGEFGGLVGGVDFGDEDDGFG